MKKGTYLRLLIVSLVAALLLSFLSILCVSWLIELQAGHQQANLMRFFAAGIEQDLAGLSLDEIKSEKGAQLLSLPFQHDRPGGELAGGPPQLSAGRLPPPPPHGPPFQFWLVTESGEVLFNHDHLPLPEIWENLAKPSEPHEVISKRKRFSLFTSNLIIKLEHQPPLYLLVNEDHSFMAGPILLSQALITFAMVAFAVFVALSLTFYYLRRKSKEASAVLLRLEQGDLDARFKIERFDEFGGLLLDFNRMATEIQHLMIRVNQTERTRKQLLQELGHDLRTPLTSLTTSFENMRFYFREMSEEQKTDVFEMIEAEIGYLKELIESLMTIAQLDQPNYKSSTATIELSELLSQELRSRRGTDGQGPEWLMTSSLTGGALILGDPHLIRRLFKNAFDNAARFAQKKVHVEIDLVGDDVEVRVRDDGPGLGPEDLELFGKRREQRVKREGGKLNFSLGLGSVIMKAISDLHGGRISVQNVMADGRVCGAVVSIRFRRVQAN